MSRLKSYILLHPADTFDSFYYADERQESGRPVYSDISGEGAAKEYLALAERKDQGPWDYTFVANQGYVVPWMIRMWDGDC